MKQDAGTGETKTATLRVSWTHSGVNMPLRSRCIVHFLSTRRGGLLGYDGGSSDEEDAKKSKTASK